jgi:hypothetical protein
MASDQMREVSEKDRKKTLFKAEDVVQEVENSNLCLNSWV